MPLKPRTPCTYCGQPATTRGRCERHARGTTSARGYDHRHKLLRSHWERIVATGTVRCARCTEPIRPDEPWDLGHKDDRSQYNGPEHAHCNRSAAAKRQMSR